MLRYALILAADQYRDPQISKLRYAERDARVIEGFLRESAGFDRVEELYGASLTKTVAIELAETMAEDLAARGGGLLFIIYAGHGYTQHNRHGLLCSDARLRDLDEFEHVITVDKLRKITAIPGVDRQLVVDACRTNLREGQRSFSEGYQTAGLRNLVGHAGNESGGGFSVLASCDEDEQAVEVEALRHGIFMWALLEELRNAHRSGLELRLDDRLVDGLRDRVTKAAKHHGLDRAQRPWSKSNTLPPAILAKRSKEWSEGVAPTLPQPVHPEPKVRAQPASPYPPSSAPRPDSSTLRADWLSKVNEGDRLASQGKRP